MTAEGLRMPFYLEHELRARHPEGVIARLSPYMSYYWSNEPGDDQPPFPVTLFVVDTEEIEATYVSTAARDDPDVATHPGVLYPRAVQHGDTREVLATVVGGCIPATGAVRHERLHLRLAVPPDASRPVGGDT